MTISRDEWLTALQEAEAVPLPNDPSVLSISELGSLFGVGVAAATRKARVLLAAGKAVRTDKLIRQSDGRVRKVPAYRLVKDGPQT